MDPAGDLPELLDRPPRFGLGEIDELQECLRHVLFHRELTQQNEVVTGVTGLGSTRTTNAGAGAGNPLMPAGRGSPPGGRGR